MPWTVDDVERYNSGLTDAQKRQWVEVANNVLARCLADGKERDYCEASAIRQANGVVKENDMSENDVIEAKKTEDGQEFPASDYAYVPDPDKPSTWKLRLTSTPGGEPDPRIVGAAIAALGAGFRGQKVDIPEDDLPAVKRKVRAAWRKANPDKDDDEMPEAIREAQDMEIAGEIVPLVERAVAADGTVTVKVIRPGWGTSGYYPAETLARDGPKVFRRGVKMFWDHPTASEEAERPEGSLDTLAGEFISDAVWRENGPDGPGLYADAKLFGRFRDAVKELAPHIGVSIRAMGKAKEAEIEGKRGPLIEQITTARSVDFVTMPGAGGKIVQLFEAARSLPEKETDEVNVEEAQRLTSENEALRAEIAQLRQALILREATDYVLEELAKTDLPEAARQRLTRELTATPPVADGALDREAYRQAIEARVQDERAYIESLAPKGQIRGMGATQPRPAADVLRESFEHMYRKLGMGAEQAAMLAKIAAEGR